ncbi:hypothetical protein HKX48_009079 [Thoreauomyces humboldtii]|nr:hypothetical protein HKX48_009079 [Thoreauomyces humboldtii]
MSVKTLFLIAALVAIRGAGASVSNQTIYPDTCGTSAPTRFSWIINTSTAAYTAASCGHLDSQSCLFDDSIVLNYGGKSVSSNCLDPTATKPDGIKTAFFPPETYGSTYFVLNTYDNSIGTPACANIDGYNSLWQRQAYLADGKCRNMGTASAPDGTGTRVRYQSFSCQYDGSAYVQDWCDSTCSTCIFGSVAGHKYPSGTDTCGQMGGSLGGNIVISGYCMIPNEKTSGFPSEGRPSGYIAPPTTGVNQMVKSGADAGSRPSIAVIVGCSVAAVAAVLACV